MTPTSMMTTKEEPAEKRKKDNDDRCVLDSLVPPPTEIGPPPPPEEQEEEHIDDRKGRYNEMTSDPYLIAVVDDDENPKEMRREGIQLQREMLTAVAPLPAAKYVDGLADA